MQGSGSGYFNPTSSMKEGRPHVKIMLWDAHLFIIRLRSTVGEALLIYPGRKLPASFLSKDPSSHHPDQHSQHPIGAGRYCRRSTGSSGPNSEVGTSEGWPEGELALLRISSPEGHGGSAPNLAS